MHPRFDAQERAGRVVRRARKVMICWIFDHFRVAENQAQLDTEAVKIDESQYFFAERATSCLAKLRMSAITSQVFTVKPTSLMKKRFCRGS